MATLPQLIEVFARHDGRDHATLTQFGRVIRDEGMTPRGKRGAGAPQMTAKDAIKLLLGIYGSSSPKDARSRIERLSSLVPLPVSGKVSETEELPNVLKVIENQPTFFDAMVQVFQNVPAAIDLAEHFIARAHPKVSEAERLNLLQETVEQAWLFTLSNWDTAEIAVSMPIYKPIWSRKFGISADAFKTGVIADATVFDRILDVRFSLRTVIDLHDAVAGTQVRARSVL